ncbi:uncharacterized protein PSSP7_020B [Prochlorococcus phage P-SSP7]|uniref:Uncharacterized protein n=1 Tax=Prochlorococcus phage P-SSP7 TaxID=2908095 RepID=I3RYR7_BPPRP|nr:uncharacterized protein PSSP7_020B [Prochlorococcus phage P-SSP7]AFK33159.1 uncharacterized protein PSSP7_020B [Prochlorococcus phage P-SSP7]
MITMETESIQTSVLRFTCPHAERASYSTLICQPVVSATYEKVCVKVCQICASSIVGQGLKNLESILHQISTGKLDSDS